MQRKVRSFESRGQVVPGLRVFGDGNQQQEQPNELMSVNCVRDPCKSLSITCDQTSWQKEWSVGMWSSAPFLWPRWFAAANLAFGLCILPLPRQERVIILMANSGKTTWETMVHIYRGFLRLLQQQQESKVILFWKLQRRRGLLVEVPGWTELHSCTPIAKSMAIA